MKIYFSPNKMFVHVIGVDTNMYQQASVEQKVAKWLARRKKKLGGGLWVNLCCGGYIGVVREK